MMSTRTVVLCVIALGWLLAMPVALGLAIFGYAYAATVLLGSAAIGCPFAILLAAISSIFLDYGDY